MMTGRTELIVISIAEDEKGIDHVIITLSQGETEVGVQVLKENHLELDRDHPSNTEKVQAPEQRGHLEPIQDRQGIINQVDYLQ